MLNGKRRELNRDLYDLNVLVNEGGHSICGPVDEKKKSQPKSVDPTDLTTAKQFNQARRSHRR
jgi:hypothetical protein